MLCSIIRGDSEAAAHLTKAEVTAAAAAAAAVTPTTTTTPVADNNDSDNDAEVSNWSMPNLGCSWNTISDLRVKVVGAVCMLPSIVLQIT